MGALILTLLLVSVKKLNHLAIGSSSHLVI
jgi:hypothetical protein